MNRQSAISRNMAPSLEGETRSGRSMRSISIRFVIVFMLSSLFCEAQNKEILNVILSDSAVRSFFYLDTRIQQPINFMDRTHKFSSCGKIILNNKVHIIHDDDNRSYDDTAYYNHIYDGIAYIVDIYTLTYRDGIYFFEMGDSYGSVHLNLKKDKKGYYIFNKVFTYARE